ncbi:MAG: hypothetical protein U1F33_07020 [Alphaproteobacteria bacterium]
MAAESAPARAVVDMAVARELAPVVTARERVSAADEVAVVPPAWVAVAAAAKGDQAAMDTAMVVARAATAMDMASLAVKAGRAMDTVMATDAPVARLEKDMDMVTATDTGSLVAAAITVMALPGSSAGALGLAISARHRARVIWAIMDMATVMATATSANPRAVRLQARRPAERPEA